MLGYIAIESIESLLELEELQKAFGYDNRYRRDFVMKRKEENVSDLIANILVVFLIAIIIISLTIIFGIIFKFDFGIPLVIEIIMSVLALLFSILKKQFKELIKTLIKKEYIYSKVYDDKKIRLSFSYLIRIKINNKYFLVKSSSRKNMFQPVGGVYHIDNPVEIKDKTGFYRDEHPGDPNDIRGNIKGKQIKKFIRWFNKNNGHEIGPYREFKEELVDTNILPKELFNEDNLKFSFCDTFYKGIYQDEFYKVKTLLRFDIFELTLNEEQLKYVIDLKNKNIRLATYSEIETLGVTKDHDERLFGTQTPFILEDYKEKENLNE